MNTLWLMIGLMIGASLEHPLEGILIGLLAMFVFGGKTPWSPKPPRPWEPED